MERKRIVVTDLTRMRDFDVCLAGIEVEPFGACIRPLLSRGAGHPTLHPDERWLRSSAGQPIRLFALVSLDTFANIPTAPHTEDWAVSARAPIVERVLDETERRVLLHSIEQPEISALFGAPIHWSERSDGLRSGGWVQPGEGTASLGTIRVEAARFHVFRDVNNGMTKHSVVFRDARGDAFRLSITDLAFRGWADALRRTNGGSFEALDAGLRATFQPPRVLWLRIGLARAWARDQHVAPVCYLQVTGVHSIPDYLEGASWQDFRQGLA